MNTLPPETTASPPRAAHVHIMRTGGTWFWGHLAESIEVHQARICDSWRDLYGRDWTAEEMHAFCERPGQQLVHNHVVSWDRDLVHCFQQSGHFVFAFVRPLGDQLCSLYAWAKAKTPKNSSWSPIVTDRSKASVLAFATPTRPRFEAS